MLNTKLSPFSLNITTKNFSFEKKILIFSFVVFLMIVAIVFLYTKINAETKHSKGWVTHTERILSLTNSILDDERNIVFRTRSFIITGNESYLQSYAERDASLEKNLAELKQLTQDNPWQQQKLDSFTAAYKAYSVIRQRAIDVRRQRNFLLRDVVPLIEEANKALARMNAIFSSLQAEEKRLLAKRNATYQKQVDFTRQAMGVLIVVFIISILVAFIIVYRNSVRRNKAEAALRKSEGLIRGIIDHAPILVNVKDTSGRYMLVNQQFASVLKAKPEELIGKTSHQFLAPETAALNDKEDSQVISNGQASDSEVKIPAADGLHTYITSKFPLFDEEGNIYGIGSTFYDITDLKTAHENLRKSYERQQTILNGLQLALNASSDLLCIVNEKGEFVMLSDTSEQLFGYTPKEMMSKKYEDFVAEEDKAKTALISQQILAGEAISDFTNHYKRKDGSFIPIIWSAKWLPEDKLIYCIARNGTEKAQTAQQLAQSQSRLLHAQKIAKLGNWDWDLKNNTWSCSEGIYHLLGIENDKAVNITQALWEFIHPDDQHQVLRERDEALMNGKKLDTEHRIIRPDNAVCFVQTKGEISFGKEGRPTWLSGTMQDITHRKQAEIKLNQLNADLEKRAEELKASNAELERFAYVASHDLQEPLRMVTSFLALLQMRHQAEFDETSKKYIHFAVDGAERMKGLIQDLLQYSRVGSSGEPFTTVDLNAVMNDVRPVYAEALHESGGLLKAGTLPVVTGHKMQLYQLLQNLVGNAIKYRSSESPVIEVGYLEKDAEWQFFVRDNGIGIDPKYFDKIFVIFQRLHGKSDYSGTGIGLAICKKIVERHGGRIWVESHPGQGSTFYFTLQKNTDVGRS